MIKKIFKKIATGFKGVFSGLYFIHAHTLWKYVSFPILITAVIAFFLKTAIATGASIILAKILSHYLAGFFPILANIPFSITPALSFMIFWPVYWLLSFVMTFFYNLVGSLVWSFFATPLQEKVELITTGKIRPVSFQSSLKWSGIGIIDAIKDIALFLILFALSFLWVMIPVVGLGFQFIFMVLVNSFFIGRNNFKAAACSRFKSAKERNAAVHKVFFAESIGLGLPEVLASYLPSVNVFVFFFLWAGALVSAMRRVAKKLPTTH